MVGEDESEVGCDIAREAIEVELIFILNCICIWYLAQIIWGLYLVCGVCVF